MANFLNEIGKFLLGEGMSKFKEKVDRTINDIEQRIERATIKVIKTSILFLMMTVGLLFMLIGFAKFLNETVPSLAHGLGTVLIGAILMVLALFVRIMK
jgi:protein-S-isoprenylcysteine O-methyltransferase Ste14